MKFEYDGLIVGYIKELLHSFNLPMIQVYTDNTELYEGKIYLKDDYICKYINGEFIKLTHYSYNSPIINITKNLIINSSVYDAYTHRYLGDYLRFLRDYKNLNLMGMYNCFTNEQLGRVNHTVKINRPYFDIFEGKTIDNSQTFSIRTQNNNFTYYSIPIKFNQVYTIALDCQSKFDIACILYNNTFLTATPDELINESYQCISGSKFTHPFIYNTHFDCAKDLWNKEKDLKLIIKLPKGIKSSITILEGNFLPCSNVVDGNFIVDIVSSDEELSDMYYSKNSLLLVNDGEIYAFADRLIEYLLGNAITNIDPINRNIELVQDYVYKDKDFQGYYGIWDKKLRDLIYEYTLKTDKTMGNTRYGNTVNMYNIVGSNLADTKFIEYTLNAPSFVDEEGRLKNLGVGESFDMKQGDVLTIYSTYFNTVIDKYWVDASDSEGGKWVEEETVIETTTSNEYTPKQGEILTLTNATSNEMINDNSAKSSLNGLIEFKSTPEKIEPKRFIDLYNDIYGYVDKDVESLLRLL